MTWQGRPLGSIEPAVAHRPTIGDGDLVYPASRHLFAGEPESLKTIAAYAIALERIRTPVPGAAAPWVALVDWEMGAQLARQRFAEMGATLDELDQIVHFEPDAAPTPSELAAAILQPTPAALVIYDASAGAYGVAGLDDNKRQDVERFGKLFITPLWKAGVATIVLDHVTKSKDGRGRWPIGSERKHGGADVVLGFEIVKQLARGGDGLIRIVTHKDRFGFLPRPRAAELELHSDPQTHAITWTWHAPSAADDEAEWIPTVLMEKVSRYLELHPDGANRSAIYDGVSGKRPFLVTAVTKLLDHQYAEEIVPGKKGTAIRARKPFRAESFPGSQTVPDGSRNGPSPIVPPFPPPTGGNGNGNDHDQDEVERLAAKYQDLTDAPEPKLGGTP